MSELHTTASSIAAALRRAADDLDKIGDGPLSPVLVYLGFQAVGHRGTFDERKHAVDVLAVALTGVPGETEKGRNAQHRLESFTPRLGGDDVQVSVFTAVKDFRSGGAS